MGDGRSSATTSGGLIERLFVRLDRDPLYAPETSIPRGTLRELRIPAGLAPWVAHVTAYEQRLPAHQAVKDRVLPGGAVHLIFELPFELHGATAPLFVAGPTLRPAMLSLRGDVRGLSVKLRPGAAPALFRTSAHEFADRAVSWDELAPVRERSLPDRLREAASHEDRAAILGEALRRMVRDADAPGLSRTLLAAERLHAGDRSLPAVARALGIGERRLQQLFRQHLGLSPRAWRRLARWHDCLRLLREPRPLAWAGVAAQCGFADQSHLVHEFRSICGLTPTQFLERRRPAGPQSSAHFVS